jgi:hypothetical protein
VSDNVQMNESQWTEVDERILEERELLSRLSEI